MDDQFVGKFLTARNNDTQKAADMLAKHLEWRKAENVDNVLNEYFGKTATRPDIHELYSCGFWGTDRSGNPLFIERPGQANVSEAFSKLGMEFMTRWHICVMETGRDRYRTAKAQGIVAIMDATGIGMAHVSKAALNFFRTVSAMDQDNYPEHLVTCFIINAGKMAKFGWKMVSPFLDVGTRTKMRIFDSDYQDELEKLVAKDQLPAFLGGTYPEQQCLRVFGGSQ